jgi:hypothetical protein
VKEWGIDILGQRYLEQLNPCGTLSDFSEAASRREIDHGFVEPPIAGRAVEDDTHSPRHCFVR